MLMKTWFYDYSQPLDLNTYGIKCLQNWKPDSFFLISLDTFSLYKRCMDVGYSLKVHTKYYGKPFTSTVNYNFLYH